MKRISSGMKLLASVLLLSIVYQGDSYRFEGLQQKFPDFKFDLQEEREILPVVDSELDRERQILALERNPSIIEASTSQKVVSGFELSGNLEGDIGSEDQFLDKETEIAELKIDQIKTFEAVDDLESLYQIRFPRPGIVGYCASNSEWSPWHNRDRPSGTGDWEVKNLYLPKGTCADKNPSGIEARLVFNKKPYYFGGNILSISPSTGLVCQSKLQKKGVKCQDYEIRFCCRPDDYNDGIVGKCPKGEGSWTSWHSRDRPSGSGDWEVRSLYKPKGTCADGRIPPLAIQAKLVSNNKPYQFGGDVVTVNPTVGFICKNRDQKDGRCNDYKVRYCCKKEDYNDGIVGNCPRDGSWTPWHSRDRPSGTGDWEVRSLYQPKGTCADGKTPPLAIQARLFYGKQPYQAGGDVVTVNPSLGFICKNNNQLDGRCNDYEVRYCCKKEDDGIVGRCDLRTSYWTPWHNRDAPSGSGDWEVRSLYRPEGTCADNTVAPTAIQGRLVGSKKPWTSSGEILSVDPDDGLICLKRDQPDNRCENYEVRYCCRREKKLCPGDLVFNKCGTACPNICGRRSLPYCTMQCVPGCQCPSGLWQTSDNRCVPAHQCPDVITISPIELKPIAAEEIPFNLN